jgi:signal transduction histidine kinase/ligand-binding sensor domain-containing protein
MHRSLFRGCCRLDIHGSFLAVRLLTSLLALATVLVPGAALADGSPRRLAHYTHQTWTEATGAPAPVWDMAQGPDGFLWLATGEGLFRFDGMSFERIVPQGTAVEDDYPTAVFVARNRDVWTAFKTSRRFAVYRDGVLRVLDAPPAPAWIMTMAEGPDGALWALTAAFETQLLRFQNGRWDRFDAERGLPRVNGLSMVLGRDGTVWVSSSSVVSRLPPGGTHFQTVRDVGGNPRLSVDPSGRIWVSDTLGSYPLTGPGGRGAPPPLRARYPADSALIRGAPLFDRDGNLWIATHYDGVQRVGLADAEGPSANADAKSLMETARGSDRLSSDVTNQILEDREGNIWIGTEKGLDRFRPATVRVEAALTSPAAFGDKLLAAADGTVYIGEAKTIYRVRPGGDPEPVLQNILEPQSLCEAPDGAIWIVLPKRVLVWNGRTTNSIDRPNTGGISYDCAFDRHGDFWYSAHSGGLNRYHNGAWDQPFGPVGTDASAPVEAGPSVPTTMERDAHGNLVAQFGRELAFIDGDARRVTPLNFGASDPKVLTLYGAPNGDVFAAGAFGLTRYRGGQEETIWTRRGAEANRINGIVQTPDGDTWLAYPRTLVRMRGQELDHAFAVHGFDPPTLSLGFGDGLINRPHSHTQRALVQGGDGRIWIATETGTLWMDPRRIVRSDVLPGLAIKALAYDGHLAQDPGSLTLPAATSTIEIDFAVLSFADPKAVSVRYMLEGYDTGWIDPGGRRQAFYTNLPPRAYRFRLIAANADGTWDRAGAAVGFEVPPTFLQSYWFLTLCVALTLLLGWLAYRLRMAQVASGIRTRLEARLGERERIARELHDTLLQSVQGLVLRFQSVANRMPPDDLSRAQLESALTLADEVIVEGRDRVRDLRASDNAGDALGNLQQLADAAGFASPIPIRMVVEGTPRQVHRLVAAEIRRIASEALFNIARHARAHAVDVAITYGDRQLAIQIRDDGVGIAESVLAHGSKDGHFGLIGMRERAERIGGALSIHSSAGEGTDVILTLPAGLAYVGRTHGWRSHWPWRSARERTDANG